MIGKTIVLDDLTFEIFLFEDEIIQAIRRMAVEINSDFKGKEVVILGVLNGSFMVISDLVKHLNLNMSMDFVKLQSYQGEKSTGDVQLIQGLTAELKGKNVLIVEDIIDTGQTLGYLRESIKNHHPKSVKIATLLLKEEVFQNKFPIHYHGISIPDKFVVGYGMDYKGLGRQLNEIYVTRS